MSATINRPAFLPAVDASNVDACTNRAPHGDGRAGHANQDGVAVARDQVYIIRDTQACPNRLGAMAAASAPAPAVPAAGMAPAPVLGKPALSTAG